MTKPPPPSMTKAEKEERLRLKQVAGAEAMADYLSTAEQVEQRTAKLRAMRLERDRQLAVKPATPKSKTR